MNEKNKQSGIIGWLLGRTQGVRFMWTLSILSRVTHQLMMVAILVLAGRAILDGQFGTLLWWMVGLSLVKALLRYLEHFAGHWVAFTMLTRLRTEFYNSLVPQAPAVVKGNAAAELSERATRDIDRIEVFFAHTIPPAIAALVVPVVSALWTGFVLGWQFALIIVVAGLLMTVGPAVARKLSWQDNQNLAATNAEVATHLGDSIQGLREVVAFGAQEQRMQQWDSLEVKVESIRKRIRTRATVRSALLVGIELLALVLIVGLASPEVLVPAIQAALVWVAIWAPLRGVDDFVDGLDEALASADRVRTSILTPPQVADTAVELVPVLNTAGPLVSVESVSFGYDSDTLALQDISFELIESTWTFVVGVSGGGKSTLAALLARGWDPGSGQVRYQGSPIANYPLADLRSRVMLVVQRPSLLSDTLGANLRLGAPNATDQQLWDALRLVDLDQWAGDLPGQLSETISTDGANLSGGQIQRLAIARALVATPEFLILDEATSQLDDQTAAVVRQRISKGIPELTILEVSHQVDRIPSDGRVLVIDAGSLVEDGQAAELRQRPGGYLSRLVLRGV